MAVLHSVLAAYGALDQVAVQTQDPEMRAAVERLLPGTTGPDQRGWFAEIQEFVTKKAREQALQNGTDVAAAEAAAKFPDVNQAVTEIMSAGGDSAEMTHRVKQRLLYAGLGITALLRLKDERSVSVPVLEGLDQNLLMGAFAVVADPVMMADPQTSATSSPMTFPRMLNAVKDRGADGWTELMAEAAQADNPAMAEIAATPAVKALGESIGPPVTHDVAQNGVLKKVTDQGKVTSEVITVKGRLCSLLTTEFSRTPYDITKVLEVIDPQNWDNANKFFADMKPQSLAPDGRSSQILEEVSTHPDIYRIKTDLKYVKEDRSNDTFVINYDFADSRGSDDSQQVKVDSGFILVGPSKDGAGVRVLTSKMVAIDGLSPTAVAVFAHAMGWLSIGEMMMFGSPVDQPGDPIEPWEPSPDPSNIILASRGAQTTPSAPGREVIQPVSQLFVREATNAVADYVQLATQETAVVADKWFRGELSVSDVVEHTEKLGGKLASEPFRLLNKMMKNAAGPASAESPADQTGGNGSP